MAIGKLCLSNDMAIVNEARTVTGTGNTGDPGSKDGNRLTIKGISINLPYEQLKQKLSAKFGGIWEEGNDGKTKASRELFFDENIANWAISLGFTITPNGLDWVNFKNETAYEGNVYLSPKPDKYVLVRTGAGYETKKGMRERYIAGLNAKYPNAAIVHLDVNLKNPPKLGRNMKAYMIVLDDGIVLCILYDWTGSYFIEERNAYVSQEEEHADIYYFDRVVRAKVLARMQGVQDIINKRTEEI